MKTLVALACVLVSVAQAQVFSLLPAAPPRVPSSVPGPRPTRGPILSVDPDALRTALASAPAQRLDAPLDSYGLMLSLPDPSGQPVDCFVANSPVMQPELQARFPQIQTYVVESLDRSASGRLELSPRGITAILRTDRGVWMIDPWQSADPLHAVTYWLADLPGGDDWVCHTTPGIHGFGTPEASTYAPRALQTLRTLRLAMACTGEYGLYHSQIQGHAPNVADPLAAIVTVVARANVVYENDLAIHFNLVANNDQIIFYDPDTDPYASTCGGNGGTDCSGSHLGVNITELANRIGNENFDIGHIVTRIFGGVAYLSAVCSDSKAGGVSGIPRGGDADPFTALVVIHEMGHQFGANHTFSGTRGRCLGNVNLSTAWEAGSGSSPMAYAGGCPVGDAPPTDNIVQFAEPFFHHGSFREMQSFLGRITCPAETVTSNNTPVIVSTSGNASIPPGTPFVLTVNATDADGDLLTYSWEEYDSGFARPLSGDGAEDNGQGALFRVFTPVFSPMRTFPQISDVLSGVPTPGERLPTVTGVTRRFRAIVRDNHAGFGGAAVSPFVSLSIPSGTAPFIITSPAQDDTLPGGAATITWTRGGTHLAPISCSSVTIRLSTDDGATFPQVLGTFPNSGSANVTLPETSAHARIRIDAVGGIFFAISRPFTLDLPCVADFNMDGGVDGADVGAFFDVWSTGDNRGDLNADGGVDGADVEFFFFRWEAGC